jgi:hypothetical protein
MLKVIFGRCPLGCEELKDGERKQWGRSGEAPEFEQNDEIVCSFSSFALTFENRGTEKYASKDIY